MQKEIIAVKAPNPGYFWVDGHLTHMPDDWEFVPSGDPALTRRLKAAVPSYW